MTEVHIRVESAAEFFERARAAARRIDGGDFRGQAGELSFDTLETLLKVLTPNRWKLLRKLRSSGPSSIRALAHALARDYRGVHSDVVVLLENGLIERSEYGKILVPWSRITAEMSLDVAA
jgi:predicted transcriptional regulator